MKKIKIVIFILLLGFVFLPIKTFAASTMELIPVGINANVSTDLFDYDFVYNTTGVTFNSIKNNTTNKVPVSINILLFDEKKVNIGYLTYCSDKDISSDYAGFKLNPSASTNFYIKVVAKYMVEGNTIDNVKYIAVQDENKYCRIGGYDKYKDLTLEQISGGRVSAENSENVQLTQMKAFLKNNLLRIILIVGFIVFGIILILGLFINTLHRKIYNHGTILSFIPVANMYLCVKLAFGSTVGIIYIIALIASSLLSTVVPALSGVVGLLGLISFIVVIYKLLSKNYSLFIGSDKSKDNNITIEKKNINNEEKTVPAVPTVEEVIEENKEEALDLSYGTKSSDVTNNKVSDSISSNTNTTVDSNSTSVSGNSNNNGSAFDNMFDFNGNVDKTGTNDTSNNKFINTNNINQNDVSTNDDKNKEGESDLSKFFQ